MGYLLPADYEQFNLPKDTKDAWVTVASAMIDAYCRRPTLGVMSYTERVRVSVTSHTVRLSYGPLVSVDAVKARYAPPRLRDERHAEFALQYLFASTFGLPGQWTTVDPATLDVYLPTSEFSFAYNVMALCYSEAEVTYTAGLAVIPEDVKSACAQVVKNAQTTPGFNVKASKMDSLQTQYFSGSVIDDQVKSMLRPYVAERLG